MMHNDFDTLTQRLANGQLSRRQALLGAVGLGVASVKSYGEIAPADVAQAAVSAAPRCLDCHLDTASGAFDCVRCRGEHGSLSSRVKTAFHAVKSPAVRALRRRARGMGFKPARATVVYASWTGHRQPVQFFQEESRHKDKRKAWLVTSATRPPALISTGSHPWEPTLLSTVKNGRVVTTSPWPKEWRQTVTDRPTSSGSTAAAASRPAASAHRSLREGQSAVADNSPRLGSLGARCEKACTKGCEKTVSKGCEKGIPAVAGAVIGSIAGPVGGVVGGAAGAFFGDIVMAGICAFGTEFFGVADVCDTLFCKPWCFNCGPGQASCLVALPPPLGTQLACVTIGKDHACSGCRGCEAPRTCQNFRCECPRPFVECDGECVDPSSDTLNCGRCGNACNGLHCVDGTCQCPFGMTLCNAAGLAECSDLMTDDGNCGQCTLACPTGQHCVGGTCNGGPFYCTAVVNESQGCTGPDPSKTFTDPVLCEQACFTVCPASGGGTGITFYPCLPVGTGP